jgi:hypothetical protein
LPVYANKSHEIGIRDSILPINEKNEILEIVFDQTSNEQIILQEDLLNKDLIIELYKIYNILQWFSSINLSQAFPEVMKDFSIRTFDPMSYSQKTRQGTLLSELKN